MFNFLKNAFTLTNVPATMMVRMIMVINIAITMTVVDVIRGGTGSGSIPLNDAGIGIYF